MFIFLNKIKTALILINLFIFIHKINAQETANVEILNSTEGEMFYENEEPVRKLKGNVKLKHKGTLMYCDEATIYANNNIFAQNNVKIVRPKGTTIVGQILNYYSAQKLAHIQGNVILTDKKAKLYTPDITYDMNNETGYFTNGGKVVNDSTTITSKHGTYYTETQQVFFKFNVVVDNPNYKLKSDTLEYNTKIKRNYFYKGTTIENDSGYIWCNKGWYDEKTNTASFGVGTIIYNMPQWLMTDSIYYEKTTGFGRIFKTFEYHDTAAHIHVFGDTAEYYNKSKRILAFKRPLLIYENDNKNPLFLRANTLESFEIDSTNKVFNGFKNVRIFNEEFQAVCDSFNFKTIDSLMRMRGKPYTWLIDKDNKKISQLKGEKIYLQMENRQPSKIYAHKESMMIQEELPTYFNQISADTILIFLKNKKIDFMKAFYNAKSIYYAEDAPKGYLGLNRSESHILNAYFNNSKLDRIVFLEKPKATFYPVKDINITNSRLDRFFWNINQRPKSKEDL